ncbi:unnamed protein product [Sphagnum tenellum]
MEMELGSGTTYCLQACSSQIPVSKELAFLQSYIVASETFQNSQESSGLDYVNASLINEDFADKNISSKGKYLCSTIDKEGLPHNHV